MSEPSPLLITDVQARVGRASWSGSRRSSTSSGARFAAAGHEIALVGGPVRDAMLGRLHNDLDFTTSARPEVTERLLAGWADAIWDIGRAFGTIGCREGDWQVEITTYRSEAYDPRVRKPEVKYGDTLGRRPRPAATSRSTRWRSRCPSSGSSTRSAAWSTSRTGCCGPRGGPRTPSPTTRCG